MRLLPPVAQPSKVICVGNSYGAYLVDQKLPRDEWPEEFDDHPIMTEAVSLETRAEQVYDRIIQTPAGTFAGIFAKLEWASGIPRSLRPSSPTCSAGSGRNHEQDGRVIRRSCHREGIESQGKFARWANKTPM